jgi:hypothetical protein
LQADSQLENCSCGYYATEYLITTPDLPQLGMGNLSVPAARGYYGASPHPEPASPELF